MDLVDIYLPSSSIMIVLHLFFFFMPHPQESHQAIIDSSVPGLRASQQSAFLFCFGQQKQKTLTHTHTHTRDSGRSK